MIVYDQMVYLMIYNINYVLNTFTGTNQGVRFSCHVSNSSITFPQLHSDVGFANSSFLMMIEDSEKEEV